jgi:hypothetical protein
MSSAPRNTTAVLAGLATAQGLPPWLMSTTMHLCAFTLLSLYITAQPRGAANVEAPRTIGITLAKVSGNTTNYLQDGDSDSAPPQTGTNTPAKATAGENALPELTDAVGPGPQLPMGDGNIGVAGLPSEGLVGANGLTQGSGTGLGKRSVGDGSIGETTVFGVKGRGTRFVYVFDRSASMSGYDGRPLAAAKRELLSSLQSLDKIHQFQIIFYNDKPHVMNLQPAAQPQLLYGDDQGKKLAATFVGGVVADGGTRHMEALLLAIQMRPDVIFFLTDADEPKLTSADLRKIRERSRGTSINAIEFGSGPSSGRYTFLQQLAAENNGQHVYVDVTSLPRP